MTAEKKRPRVLVVDDEPGVVSVLEEFLLLNGFEAVSARDPGKAIDIIRRRRDLALVVMDEKMPPPGASGVREVLERKRTPVPYIILTGYPDLTPGDAGSGEKHKYKLYKPVRFSELSRVIKKALRGSCRVKVKRSGRNRR